MTQPLLIILLLLLPLGARAGLLLITLLLLAGALHLFLGPLLATHALEMKLIRLLTRTSH